MTISRRQFLEAAAAAGAALPALASAQDAPIAAKLPTRTFGRTGLTVPILGFGSGSRFLMYRDEDEALAVLNRAIDLGVTYIDTAHSYGDGQSETRIGRLMPTRRKEVVLATKIPGRTADDAKRQIERSLKRLQTDRLDVLHIHALSDEKDLEAAEKGGAIQALYDARDQKITKAIGITCHASPTALALALERHDFDATQMALNAARARMANAPGGMKATAMRQADSFEELALPVAQRKNLGVIAMKVFGQDQLVGAAPIEAMLRYALSLPVSLASLGMPKPEFLAKNVELARAFQPLTEPQRQQLLDAIAAEKKVAFAAFLRDHADA
jgi:aryl-alcohol dehydrogenase-like predicted oxidoreductase